MFAYVGSIQNLKDLKETRLRGDRLPLVSRVLLGAFTTSRMSTRGGRMPDGGEDAAMSAMPPARWRDWSGTGDPPVAPDLAAYQSMQMRSLSLGPYRRTLPVDIGLGLYTTGVPRS